MEDSSLACGLLSNSQLKRLASRGGRNRSSTRLPVWGVNYEKGACTSPLFHFRHHSGTHPFGNLSNDARSRHPRLPLWPPLYIDLAQRILSPSLASSSA